MKTFVSLFAPLTLLSLLTSCGENGADTAETWNNANDPLNMGSAYVTGFDKLPLEGTVETKPWSDTYWPSKDGGIAARWYMPTPGLSAFSYALNSAADVQNMSSEELSTLSPAEKFDILRGRFDYPTVRIERSTKSPSALSWEGLCHGWAPAAMLYSEPNPVMMSGANDVVIPFGSSDVKALLTFYQANLSNAPARILGSRCNQDIEANPADGFRPECRDTNAGAFHIVLSNQIGLQRKAFLADVTRDLQVWNQPVHTYSSRVLSYQQPSEGAADGTTQEAIVQTVMWYTLETDANYAALNPTGDRADGKKRYLYRLELNDEKEIIGGEWISAERPDFLWSQEKSAFRGEWSILGALYNKSIRNY